jgi:hypothetical protein
MLACDFEIVDGFGAGAGGDGGEAEELAVEGDDFFAERQFTCGDKVVLSHAPEWMHGGDAERLTGIG